MPKQGSNKKVRSKKEEDRGLSPLFDDWNFSIEVTKFRENEDGSADVELKCNEKAKAFMIQEGFISLIKKSLAADKNARDGVKMREELQK